MRGTGSATDVSKSIYSLKQQQEGLALQHCSEEMKGDRELCKTAVDKAVADTNPYRLKFISNCLCPALKQDRHLRELACPACMYERNGLSHTWEHCCRM